MQATYIASSNVTGDAQVLGDAGRDIYVRAVWIGLYGAGNQVRFYNKRVAPGHASGVGSLDTTDLVFRFTQPTAAAGNNVSYCLDFGNAPLQLDGGSCHTDASQVTIIWEYVDEVSSH